MAPTPIVYSEFMNAISSPSTTSSDTQSSSSSWISLDKLSSYTHDGSKTSNAFWTSFSTLDKTMFVLVCVLVGTLVLYTTAHALYTLHRLRAIRGGSWTFGELLYLAFMPGRKATEAKRKLFDEYYVAKQSTMDHLKTDGSEEAATDTLSAHSTPPQIRREASQSSQLSKDVDDWLSQSRKPNPLSKPNAFAASLPQPPSPTHSRPFSFMPEPVKIQPYVGVAQ